MKRRKTGYELATEILWIGTMLGLTGFIFYNVGHGYGIIDSIKYMVENDLVKSDVGYYELVKRMIIG